MKALRIILLLLVAAMMPACTQNNGHIGPLFGSWHLESMTCDGEIKPQPEGTDTFWSFQGQVLNVLLVETMYESLFFIATWERENDCLELDFTHSSDSSEPGTGFYRAPYWMGFPENEILRVDIRKLNGSELILDWTSEEGQKYVYNFKKTW